MPTVGHVQVDDRVRRLHAVDPRRFIDVRSHPDGRFVARFDRAAFYAEAVGVLPRRRVACVELIVLLNGCIRLYHDGREQPLRLGTSDDLRGLADWSPLAFDDLQDASGVESAAWNDMWSRACAHLHADLLGWARSGDASQSAHRYNSAAAVERFGQLVQSMPMLAHVLYQADLEGILRGATRDVDGVLACPPLRIMDRVFTAMPGTRLPRGVDAPPVRASTPILKKWLKSDPAVCGRGLTSMQSLYVVCAALNATTTVERRRKDGSVVVEEVPCLDVNGIPKLGTDPLRWLLFNTAAEISVALASAVLQDPEAAARSVAEYGAGTLQLARTDPERAALEAGEVAERAALERGDAAEDATRAAVEAVERVRRTALHTTAASRAMARTISRLTDGRALCDWVLREIDAWQNRPEASAAERQRSASLGFARQSQAAEEWRRRTSVVLDEELEAHRDRRRVERLRRDRHEDHNAAGEAHRGAQAYADDIPDGQPFPVPVAPLEMRIVTASGTAYIMRWLQNRGELKRESEIMDHCVGRHFYYAQRAMAGQAFIYTGIEEQSGRTVFTAEFDAELRVHQVQGYGNYIRRPPEDCHAAIVEALAPYRALAREARDLLDVQLEPEMAEHLANYHALRDAHEQRLAAIRAENETRAARMRGEAEELAAAELAAHERRERDGEILTREFEF